MFMKPQIKLKQKNAPFHHTPKTKDDFVRWLKEKRALKDKKTEKQLAITRRDLSQALMVWADDGGTVNISQPLIKTIEQSQAIKEKNHEQGKR
jgi:hypothetical protein